MDWIRRNWPDLLIGVALLLVIAGIIATLLSGGSFLPFARNNTNPTNTTTTTAPSETGNTNTDLTGSVNAATEALNNSANQAADAANNAATAVTDAATEGAETVIAPVIPDLPSVDGGESATTSSTTDATATTDANTTSSATTATSTTIDTSANATSTAVDANTNSATSTSSSTSPATTTPTLSAAASSAAPYRIGVGAYGNPDNAERRAQTFREAGYPVFLGQQGNLSLVLIGPYNTSAEAEAVQAQIRSSGLEPGATVYEFNPDAESAAASATPSTSATATPTPPADASTATTTPTTNSNSVTVPPVATSGRYLQVGAYNSVESSLPQRGRLEGLGFRVVHIEESGFIKLLIGPYDDANLSVAQSQLDSQGIESFVR